MRDKLLQIRVDEDFLSKLEYLRKINGFKTMAETVRKIIEKEFRKETDNDHVCDMAIDQADDALRALPSAEPKRIKGKWEGADTQCGIACSVCGVAVDDFCHSADYMDLDYEPNFCPNCGADMN